jgi:2-oxoglutarate ferredoxin oxidoreductase subunit gamma
MQLETFFAGFGGQGIMSIGQFLAKTGMEEGKQVVWLPSYGPEMRGGTAYCTVIISDQLIGSPIISNPQALVVLNRPSMDKFAPRVKSGGTIIVNSSLIEVTSGRDDVDELLVPANDMAIECGSPRSTNMVMLGAFVARTGIVEINNLKAFVEKKFSGKVAEINVNAMMAGHRLGSTR